MGEFLRERGGTVWLRQKLKLGCNRSMGVGVHSGCCAFQQLSWVPCGCLLAQKAGGQVGGVFRPHPLLHMLHAMLIPTSHPPEGLLGAGLQLSLATRLCSLVHRGPLSFSLCSFFRKRGKGELFPSLTLVGSWLYPLTPAGPSGRRPRRKAAWLSVLFVAV